MPTIENPASTTNEQSNELAAISHRLTTARANANALPGFPGELPSTLEEAYAIQSISMSNWPDDVAGWKVGMVPESYRERLNAERLSGPIFRSSIIQTKHGSSENMPIFAGGFAAVEAEFMLQIGATIQPEQKNYSDQELMALIADVHIGAEIASSPMADVNRLGPCCVVSDFGNNAGLIVGPAIPGWSDQSPDTLTAEVTVDDVVVGTASAAAIAGGLLEPLRYLIDLCARRELVLAKGTFVSSGALTGIHDVTTASKARVDFGAYGAFDVAFKAMSPLQTSGVAAKA